MLSPRPSVGAVGVVVVEGDPLQIRHTWYVVQTQARRESVAESSLAGLCGAVFCPRYRARVSIHGYRREVARSLFPGYLFAAFDIARRLRAVNCAYGVRRVVQSGGQPAEVAAEIVAAIEARMRDGYVVLDPPLLSPGQRVEVVEGPLRGYTGIFQGDQSGARRVTLLLDLLGRSTRVIVAREAIRAAG